MLVMSSPGYGTVRKCSVKSVSTVSYLDTTKQRINSQLHRLQRIVQQFNSETATGTSTPGKQLSYSRGTTPLHNNGHISQESSIPWTKATSKRGRSPREEPTREAKYQLERMNPTTDDEQENDITENTNMVDWQLLR
jgi:hypothetical protein